MRVESLSGANMAETLAWLGRAPYDNVYVEWLIRSKQIGRDADVYVWRERERERVGGVCYAGIQIVPNAETGEAVEAFARRARRIRAPRMLVGPRLAVDRFWHSARAWLGTPAAVRASQPVYALDRAALRGGRADADVARATVAEVDELVPHSAAMIAGEIGADPRGTNSDFRGRTQRIVEAGWWWRYRVDGELAFMCNVGSATPSTAQLQGVWTPPAMRGAGHATRALAAICDHLLETYPTLCLYVNDYNASAIALYERVGFARAGEFATILL